MLRALCRHLSKRYSQFNRFPTNNSTGSKYTIRPNKSRLRLCLEVLETRLTPSVALPSSGETITATPDVHVLNSALVSSSASPSSLPAGFSPQQISQAYGFNQITFQNGKVKGDGTGQTIAIIDAYSDPTIQSDLATFDSMYGLAAPPSFSIVGQTGGSAPSTANSGWDVEQSLDVEWAHAMAPGAKILLVEANSDSLNDLLTAVTYASNQAGVSVVSMSWGSSEWSGETEVDSVFTPPSSPGGVTFVASSGDSGSSGAPEYVSVSPDVLAVGGTQLSTDSSGDYVSETAWSGSGGGISAYESQPSYQKGVVTQTSTMRAVPDVAYNASGSSPFAVYDTSGYGGWIDVYGTSAGAPQWAALVAIADQGRALNGEGSLDGATQTLPALYQLPSSDFHDITSGSNGAYSAGPGYDLVTGLGSPVANEVVAGLVAYGSASPPAPPWVATPASATPSPVTGTTTNLSVLGGDSGGASSLTYTWSVLGEPSGATTPTFSINASNAAQNTTATFYTAGTYTFEATITDASGLSVTSEVAVTVNPTLTSIAVSPSSATVTDGHTQQFTAMANDQFGNAMSTQPTFTWTLTSGVGTLSSAGLYTAPSSGTGTATVQASTAGLTATASAAFGSAPAALSNVTATMVAANQVNLTWTENVGTATSIVIQRSTDDTNWTTLISLAGTATSYSDTSVNAGPTYYYRLSADNSFGNSPYRLVVVYSASGNVLTYNYTNGTLSTATLTNSSGALLQTYNYNAQGRVTSVDYANGNVLAYTYTNGILSSATLTNSSGTVSSGVTSISYSYNAQGQLSSEAVYETNNNVFTRTYNSDGSSTATLTNSSGTVSSGVTSIAYAYNAQSQLTSETVSYTNGNVFTRTYNSDGSSTATLTNSSGTVSSGVTSIDYAYNAQGQLTSYVYNYPNNNVFTRTYNSDGSSTATLTNSSGTVSSGVTSISYSYNAQGQLTAYEVYYSNGNVFSRTYNSDGSSTATLTNSSGTVSSGVTSIDYSYNAQSQLTSYVYNYPNGNVFTRTYNSDGSSTATLTNSSGTVLETYTYNAQGQLVSESPGG